MYLKFEFCSVWHFMSFIFNFQFSVKNLKFKVHWYFLCCIIGFTFSKSVQAERFRQIVYLFFQVGNVEYMGCAWGRCFSHVISYQESMQFFFKNLKDKSPFHGSLISIFWTSHDVCPGHQNQVDPLACVLANDGLPQIQLHARNPCTSFTASKAAEPLTHKIKTHFASPFLFFQGF